MSLISYLNKIFSENDKFNYSNSLIVCGAGVSMDSQLPSGDQIINKVFNDFKLTELGDFFVQFNKEIVLECLNIDTTFFNQVRLEVLFNGIRQVASEKEFESYVFATLFSKAEKVETEDGKMTCVIQSNFNHYLIAHFIQNGGKCITFNFDELIEAAYEGMYNKKLHQIVFPLDKEDFHSEPCIIKAHGTFEHQTCSMRNIGIDTDNLFLDGFSPNDTEFLESVLDKIENIVCIGYSVSDTLDFLPFLKDHFKDKKVNFYLFNYKEDLKEDNVRSIDLKKNRAEYFQIDHFIKEIIKDFAFIDYNPKASLAGLIKLPEKRSTIYYEFDHESLLEITSTKREIVKLKIIETLSLSCRFGTKELESLKTKNSQQYKIFNFDKENRNGEYGKNTNYILREFIFTPNTENYNRLFGILNEFFFLTPKFKKILPRILTGFGIFLMWVSLFILCGFLSKENKQFLVVNRNIYMPLFRLLKFTRANNFITKAIAKYTLKLQMKSAKIAIYQRSLKLFRYIQKDKIKVEYLLNKNSDETLEEIVELMIKNIDTNHYIDITNLARLKYEITKNDLDKKLVIRLTRLTNDVLNESKIV